VLATDALIWAAASSPRSPTQTMEELNSLSALRVEPQQPGRHPGRCQPERYAKTLEVASKDKNSDGLLVILTPQDMTDPTQTAEQLRQAASKLGRKPVLASWMGGADVAAGVSILNRASIPPSPTRTRRRRSSTICGTTATT
jgi:acetyltransferase